MVDDSKRRAAAAVFRLSRYAAVAVAAGRVGLGVTALVKPSVPGRPWVGPSADEPGAQVLARALGARDLALGLGALAAVSTSAGGRPAVGRAANGRAAAAWYAAGALSDALDAAVTAAAWPHLPKATRWLIAAAAGGAALTGAAGAVASVLE
jgi:hypothetical protein